MLAAIRPNPASDGSHNVAARLQQLDLDILRQRRIVDELERDLHAVVWAKTLLRALERARRDLSDQLIEDKSGLN